MAENTSCTGILARAYWMIAGPALLVPMGLNIIQTGNGWLTAADLGFFLVLGGILLARGFEFLGGSPQTGDGKPATPAHLKRFVAITVAVGLGVWIVANVLGNYLLA